MPCYLAHGFRWDRKQIRIHIIMNNVEDAAAEYLVGPETSRAMLESFRENWPEPMSELPHLQFIEQYDPEDTSARSVSQPYAFVVDMVRHIDLSINVQDGMQEIESIIGKQQRDALDTMREALSPNEKIGWWVVYNGDESRLHDFPPPGKSPIRQKKSIRKLFRKAT